MARWKQRGEGERLIQQYDGCFRGVTPLNGSLTIARTADSLGKTAHEATKDDVPSSRIFNLS